MIEIFGVLRRRREKLLEQKREHENEISDIDQRIAHIDAAEEYMDKVLKRYMCPSCSGSGEILHSFDPKSGELEVAPCETCGGTGILMHEEVSDVCDE